MPYPQGSAQLTLRSADKVTLQRDKRPDECPRDVDRQTEWPTSTDERSDAVFERFSVTARPHKTSSSKP